MLAGAGTLRILPGMPVLVLASFPGERKMKHGNWVPISKAFVKHLPLKRPFTELEAAFSLQVDYDNDKRVTVAGYASLWRWSRGKVMRFMDAMGIIIEYPENTRKKQNQNGQIMIQITDRSRAESGQIRMINNKDLEAQADRKRTDKGQIKDRSRSTTIQTDTKTNTEDIGEFKNVVLSESEIAKLENKLGKAATDDLIERLSEYMSSKGKKYKSHYATILSWYRKDRSASVNQKEPFMEPGYYDG